MSGPGSDGDLYPLGLRLRGRTVVVVGGGAVALRRATSLYAAGARVLVVAPQLSAGFAELLDRGAAEAVRREYRDGDLGRAWLVMACTDDPKVNAAVAAEATRRRLWCVRADDAQASAAWVPAVGRSGSVTVAVNAGADPARAARLRDRLLDLLEHAHPSRTSTSAPAEPEATPVEPEAALAGRRVLVLGGARSGKSVTAERMLATAAHVTYVATGDGGDADPEWAARVAAHRARRPGQWETVETRDLEGVLAAATPEAPGTPVLVDCVSVWLAGVMDEVGLWEARAGADERLGERLNSLVAAWTATTRHAVAVSNEVGSGVHPATVSGRRYRDELGRLNARLAAVSDEVWFCVAGLPQRLK